MLELIGSFALVFCFAAVVIGPFLLPRLPAEEGDPHDEEIPRQGATEHGGSPPAETEAFRRPRRRW